MEGIPLVLLLLVDKEIPTVMANSYSLLPCPFKALICQEVQERLAMSTENKQNLFIMDLIRSYLPDY